MQHEAPDELAGRQRHGLVAARAFDSIVLVAERDANLVGLDQAAVGDGDAPHHRAQMGALVRDRLMPVAPTPVCNRRQRAGVTVLCRYLPHHILACPRLAPDVGEAEEGERGTIRLRMVSPIWSVVAEIDEARLVGMECESVPCKSLTQNAKDPLGIEEVLERQHGIISEADKGTSPLETWPHLELKPFVQHVVQENIREAR